MSSLLVFFLSSHIFLGIIAIAFFYSVTMNLLKREVNLFSFKRNSFGGLLAFILSWLTGGYYYVFYYGDNVKPIIKQGLYPWAHNFIMELKEHIFLYLPFLAFIVFIASYSMQDKLKENENLRKSLAMLSLTVFILGLLVAFMGIVISGAVKR